MEFNFSRTFGAGTHQLGESDLNVLADTTLGAVNFILPSINSLVGSSAKLGYAMGSSGSGVFSINITDIGNNASVNNITITTNPEDKFNGNISSAVINQNKGTAIVKPVANNLWNVFITGAIGTMGAIGETGATGENGAVGAVGATGATGVSVICPVVDITIQDISVDITDPLGGISVSADDVIVSVTGGTPPYLYYAISKDDGLTWSISSTATLAAVDFDCTEVGVNVVRVGIADSCDDVQFISNYKLVNVTVTGSGCP